MGRSREYVLRLPTMSEVRAAQRQATDALAGGLDSVAAASKRLERQTEDLAQERPRSTDGRGEKGGRIAVVRGGQEGGGGRKVPAGTGAQRRGAEGVARGAAEERRGRGSPGHCVAAPAFRDPRPARARALARAARAAAGAAAGAQGSRRRSHQGCAGASGRGAAQLREALERSRELFRRAALEGDLANLGQESKELAREQRQWNQQVASADSTRAAQAERELAARADSLAAALDRLAQGAGRFGAAGAARRRRRAGQAGGRADAAGRRRQRAGAARPSAAAGRASRAGTGAVERPAAAGARGDATGVAAGSGRGHRSGARRNQPSRRAPARGAGAAPRRATSRAAAMRAEQGAIEEGVQRLLEQMRQAAGKNALVSPQIGAALGGAQRQMQRTREAISNATPNTREGAEQAGGAVDGLNAAAYQLLRARGETCQEPHPARGSRRRSSAWPSSRSSRAAWDNRVPGCCRWRAAAAIGEQLRQLGARQRALAEELERLKGRAICPGPARWPTRRRTWLGGWKAGRIDRQVVERQERLFRRMLDAGRTLQGREEDERRSARARPRPTTACTCLPRSAPGSWTTTTA